MRAITTPIRAGLGYVAKWLWMEEEDYKWLALIVGVALAIRVAWVLIFQTTPSWDGPEYDAHGWRLAQGQGYVLADGTPTAFWPVGYPAFLAVIYLIFGHSWLAAGMANALFGAVSVALTYRLAREVLSSRLSLVAAGLVAFLPSHIISATPGLMTEALHTVFVLTTLIMACRLARYPTWMNATLLGLVLGAGLYVRPTLLLFPVVVALLIMIRGKAGIRKSVGLAGIVLLVSLMTISPWTIRNYFVMGEPILTATNGGITFYMANGPGATGRQRVVHIEDTFSDSSELTVYRESIRMGLEHILEHPVEWFKIMPIKFFYLWAGDTWNIVPGAFSEDHRRFVPVLRIIAQGYWMVIVIGAGLAAISRPFGYWLRFPAVLLPLALIGWSAFHVMFHGGSRFHAQMIPVVAIVAAHLLAQGRDWRAWLPERWRGG